MIHHPLKHHQPEKLHSQQIELDLLVLAILQQLFLQNLLIPQFVFFCLKIAKNLLVLVLNFLAELIQKNKISVVFLVVKIYELQNFLLVFLAEICEIFADQISIANFQIFIFC